MILGAHLSISKGYSRAVDVAVDIGANTFQFFTRNPRGAKARDLDPNDIAVARERRDKHSFGPLVAHGPYIVNMAATQDHLWELAQRILREDLERMEMIGAPYLVMHPGSHGGKGLTYGIERIAECINRVLTKEGKTKLLLETMAGSGNEVGGTFEELKEILDRVEHKQRLGICFDTCHTFAAGYPIHTDLEQVLEEFDCVLGIENLKALHLNDSAQPFASKRDRHANLGQGEIGLDSLVNIVEHPAFRRRPIVLETPGGPQIYAQEIQIVRQAISC